MKDLLKKRASELEDQLVEWRRHLHQHPELSFKEKETSKYIQEQLRQMDVSFQVMADTGVVAMINGAADGPIISLRADIDALPIHEKNECEYRSQNEGVMHACGHDVHTASMLGAVRLLSELKEEWKGSIKVIFQPGEEKLPGGASILIKEGVLEHPKPEQIVGQHVYPELEAGKVGFRPGKYMASADEIYLKVIGKGGHAALPDRNIDPVLITSHIIVALQQVVSRRSQPDTPTVLSFGKVIADGATNVIPDYVSVEGTFRTFDEEWRAEAHQIIQRIAEQTAEAMGGRCEVDIRKGYPFVFNDPDVTQKSMSWAKEYLGEENVIDLDMRMTGEDFAFYSQVIPGCFYRLGTRQGADGPIKGLHTPTFDIDESALQVGAGLMAWLALKRLEA